MNIELDASGPRGPVAAYYPQPIGAETRPLTVAGLLQVWTAYDYSGETVSAELDGPGPIGLEAYPP